MTKREIISNAVAESAAALRALELGHLEIARECSDTANDHLATYSYAPGEAISDELLLRLSDLVQKTHALILQAGSVS
jgi:hypothetical protein